MSRRRSAALAGLLLLLSLSSACESVRTQSMVIVDADEAVRGAASRLVIQVQGRAAGQSEWTDVGNENRSASFPYLLALAPKDGEAEREFRVVATASSGATIVSRASVIGGYLSGRTLAYSIFLSADCASDTCTDDQTCAVGGICRNAYLPPSSAPDYDPASRMDASVSRDAGGRPDATIPSDSGPIEMRLDGGPCDTPGAERCEGNIVYICGPEMRETQAFFCPCAGTVCPTPSLSNGLDPYLAMTLAAADLEATGRAVFNTDTGTVTVGGAPVTMATETIPAAGGSAPIQVFWARELRLADVDVEGSAAIALVAQIITITGELSVRAQGTTASGAGARPQADCSSGAAIRGAEGTAGAGGGGHGTSGGQGGDVVDGTGTTIRVGGAAGAAHGSASLSPFVGGCPGGVVRDTDMSVIGRPGGGGGAVHLGARLGIAITGSIDAAGGGGGNGGGGGGAGGAILLEALSVSVEDGGLFANGGGGGCVGAPGSPGSTGTAQAAGGGCASGNGSGGFGGSLMGEATEGADNTVSGGGGGGAAGRIRIRTSAGSAFFSNATSSPNASQTFL